MSLFGDDYNRWSWGSPAAEKNAKEIDGRVRAAIMAPLQKK